MLQICIPKSRTNVLVNSLMAASCSRKFHCYMARVQDLFNTMQWDVLKHPAYGLDSSLFDFHILGPLKIVLKSCMLTHNGSVQGAISTVVEAAAKGILRR